MIGVGPTHVPIILASHLKTRRASHGGVKPRYLTARMGSQVFLEKSVSL